MTARFLIAMGLFFVTAVSAQADGRADVPVAQPEAPQELSSRDQLIHYILNHKDIPDQQALLKKLLDDQNATEAVFKMLPEKDQKAFKAKA